MVRLGHSLSLGVGLGGFFLTAGAMWYARGEDAGLAGVGVVEICTIAGLAGMALGLPVSLVMEALQRQVTRLSDHVRVSGHADLEPDPLGVGMGLQGLADAVQGAIQALRQRAERLVTRRRELEVQLRLAQAQRRHAQAILDALADGVVVTNAFDEVVAANPAAGQMLGFDPLLIARQPLERVLTDLALVDLIKEARRNGDPSLRRQVEHVIAHEGQLMVCGVTLTGLTNPAGPEGGGSRPDAGAGAIAILRDVTREKAVAEMKSDFVSNVSHELRTPLSSIKAYMEMLVDGEAQTEEERANFYNIIQGETNRLHRLIDSILNINRIESGVVKVQREHVSLLSLIREVIDVMQPQARAKEIELVELGRAVFFEIFADRDMIYQALLNLVGNAIKYTPGRGRVTLSLDVDEHARTVSVSVSDTGIGIPSDDLPHVFDKFYRVADHKNIAKGTGLGLNLVKHIIETVHGGRVEVASQVGQGATFTFSLPMIAAS